MSTNLPLDTESHIIYFDLSCKVRSKLRDLQHDFLCKNPKDTVNEILLNFYKEKLKNAGLDFVKDEKVIAKIENALIDENGKRFVLDDVDGLLARIIQHENDHLNGILYIDRGDEEFKNKTVELFKKKAERAQKKLAEKEAKKRSLEAKLAAKNAKKGK